MVIAKHAISAKWAVVVCMIMSVVVLFFVLSQPSTQNIVDIISPDKTATISIVEEEFGNSFGPTYYVVSISSNGLFLRMLSTKKLLEVPSSASTTPPKVVWTDARSVTISLKRTDNVFPEDTNFGPIRIHYVVQ
jgi:hypothetical protein